MINSKIHRFILAPYSLRYLDVLMLINMIYKKFHSPNSIDTVVVRIVEKDEDDNDIIR